MVLLLASHRATADRLPGGVAHLRHDQIGCDKQRRRDEQGGSLPGPLFFDEPLEGDAGIEGLQCYTVVKNVSHLTA